MRPKFFLDQILDWLIYSSLLFERPQKQNKEVISWIGPDAQKLSPGRRRRRCVRRDSTLIWRSWIKVNSKWATLWGNTIKWAPAPSLSLSFTLSHTHTLRHAHASFSNLPSQLSSLVYHFLLLLASLPHTHTHVIFLLHSLSLSLTHSLSLSSSHFSMFLCVWDRLFSHNQGAAVCRSLCSSTFFPIALAFYPSVSQCVCLCVCVCVCELMNTKSMNFEAFFSASSTNRHKKWK